MAHDPKVEERPGETRDGEGGHGVTELAHGHHETTCRGIPHSHPSNPLRVHGGSDKGQSAKTGRNDFGTMPSTNASSQFHGSGGARVAAVGLANTVTLPTRGSHAGG